MSREGPHVLFCAFAEVPGPTAAGVRTAQMMRAFGDGFDVDGLCLKGPEVAHIERLGSARVMRVPVDNKPFLERLAAYRRALGRQLAGDAYDVVWCADLWSAAVAASYKEAQGFALVVDVDDVPSESFARRYDVDASDNRLRAEWAGSEKTALRSASVVLAPSRGGAKVITSRVDPRKVQVLARAVDREVFAPPTVELSLDGKRTVLVVSGASRGSELLAGARLLAAIAEQVPGDAVQLALACTPAGDEVSAALADAGLSDRVTVRQATTPTAMAGLLAEAHIVVVPSGAEAGMDPLALPHRALEAMACRRPTVLTGPPGAFADMLVPGEDALVSPAGDPEATAAAVAKLLDAPALREAVAQAGARRVEQEADLVTRLRQTAALLSELLGVALSPRESTAPADPFEPSQAGVAPAPPTESAPPETGSSDSASSVFTDEGDPALLRPAAPAPPSAVDVAASSVASAVAEGDESVPADANPDEKTLVAPPPEGLEELLGTPGDGGEDEWYGDTRIDEGVRYPGEPTPLDDVARATTRQRVAPEPSTSTSPPGARAFSAELMSVPEGDPWGHDTIADARPVFTADDVSKKTPAAERTPSPAERTGTGRSFLVDPDLLDGAASSPLDDATMDEMQLPREPPSSEG